MKLGLEIELRVGVGVTVGVEVGVCVECGLEIREWASIKPRARVQVTDTCDSNLEMQPCLWP